MNTDSHNYIENLKSTITIHAFSIIRNIPTRRKPSRQNYEKPTRRKKIGPIL